MDYLKLLIVLTIITIATFGISMILTLNHLSDNFEAVSSSCLNNAKTVERQTIIILDQNKTFEKDGYFYYNLP